MEFDQCSPLYNILSQNQFHSVAPIQQIFALKFNPPYVLYGEDALRCANPANTLQCAMTVTSTIV